MKEQVLARDRYACTVPGCRSQRFLQLHHIKFESLGGPNLAWNLTTICDGHHAQLHEGKLSVLGQAPYALSWSRPDDPTRNTTRSRLRFENEVGVRDGDASAEQRMAHVGREVEMADAAQASREVEEVDVADERAAEVAREPCG